jgi:hypothetical protein
VTIFTSLRARDGTLTLVKKPPALELCPTASRRAPVFTTIRVFAEKSLPRKDTELPDSPEAGVSVTRGSARAAGAAASSGSSAAAPAAATRRSRDLPRSITDRSRLVETVGAALVSIVS